MRVLLAALVASLGFAASAQANLIYAQGGPIIDLISGGSTQVVLMMSGSDYYSDSNLRLKINGGVGPAPFVTAVFGDTGGLISPPSLYAGSIWAGGSAGIGLAPQGTSPVSSGLDVIAGFATPAFTSQNTAGVYAILTISTVGAWWGQYSLTLEGTDLFNGLDPQGEQIPVPLQFAPITLQGGTHLPLPDMDATPPVGSTIALASALAPSTAVDLANAIAVTNTGGANLFLENPWFSGPDAALFSLLDGVEDVVLKPGEGATLGLRFAGAAAPGTYSATLNFVSNGPGSFFYPVTVTVVPEPSTYALAVSGLAAVLLVRRRKRDTFLSQAELHS
jgi:hypothetical protein